MHDTKQHDFIGRVLADLSGASSLPLVLMGASLGLYRTLASSGPVNAAELAAFTGLSERYLAEWLSHQAASGYLEYDPGSGRFLLPPEHAALLADEQSPFYMIPGFETAAAFMENRGNVEQAFRTGSGVLWGDQSGCLICATGQFFRTGYRANLLTSWLPSLEGVVDKLVRGARVADVGCGHGYSTIIMAEAFPESEFIGFDFHPGSIDSARSHAADHGGPDNLSFEVARAQDFPGRDYDLVTFFDCLHDMGDPVGAARHVRRSLKPDGAWMIVEPMAGDALEQNLNPVGRIFYAGSTMTCVPASLGQEIGAALGAQAGERRLRGVAEAGGFTSCRRAAETPFNMVLEACP